MKDFGSGIVEVVLAIIGIAFIAVIVGRRSQTASIITSAGNALSTVLKQATAAA